jgi:hypothetical protein
MKFALLVTNEMKPVPETIKILVDWGFTGISIGETGVYVGGDHMYVEGDEQDIINWLRPFDTVWRTKPGTPPVFQQFEAVHIP